MQMRLFFLVATLLVAATIDRAAAQATPRPQFALLIGNAKYPDSDSPLKEAINDVHAVADELRRQGFDVDIGENLSKEATQRALSRFYGKISAGSVALIFFSGYGIQTDRQTYIVPVDAQLWAEGDVKRDGSALDSILGEMNSRGAKVKIAILDASRRNPFERRFRSFSAGLAPVTAPVGSLVMYSAAPSAVANDATGDHGVLATELIKQIGAPGSTAEEVFNRTRTGVSRATQGQQVPWFSSTLADDFSFGSSGRPTAPTPVTSVQPPPLPPVVVNQPPISPPPVVTPPPLPPPVSTAKVDNPPPTPVIATPPQQPPPQQSPQQPPPSGMPAQIPPPPNQPSQATALADDPAIKDLDSRIKSNPRDSAAYAQRGQAYASRGDYPHAVKDFDEAIRLNPNDVESLNNRCWAHGVVGDLQAAMRDCNRALEIRPQYADALDSRGLLNLKMGMAAYAIADYNAALKLAPRLASSLYGRGLAKQRTGNKADGDNDIAAAKAIDPRIAEEFAGYGLR